MTLVEIKNCDKPMLTVRQAASVIGMHPDTLRYQARYDPKLLGFPVTLAKSRTYIPRIPFINYLEGRGAIINDAGAN